MSAIPEGSHQPAPHQHPIPSETISSLAMVFVCFRPGLGDALGVPRSPALAEAPVWPQWQGLDSPPSAEPKNVYNWAPIMNTTYRVGVMSEGERRERHPRRREQHQQRPKPPLPDSKGLFGRYCVFLRDSGRGVKGGAGKAAEAGAGEPGGEVWASSCASGRDAHARATPPRAQDLNPEASRAARRRAGQCFTTVLRRGSPGEAHCPSSTRKASHQANVKLPRCHPQAWKIPENLTVCSRSWSEPTPGLWVAGCSGQRSAPLLSWFPPKATRERGPGVEKDSRGRTLWWWGDFAVARDPGPVGLSLDSGGRQPLAPLTAFAGSLPG